MLSDGAGQVKLFLVTMARVPHLRAFLPFSSSVQSTVPIFPIFSLRCMPWWTPSGTSLPTLASPAPVIPAGLNYLTSHGHSLTTWRSPEYRGPVISNPETRFTTTSKLNRGLHFRYILRWICTHIAIIPWVIVACRHLVLPHARTRSTLTPLACLSCTSSSSSSLALLVATGTRSS